MRQALAQEYRPKNIAQDYRFMEIHRLKVCIRYGLAPKSTSVISALKELIIEGCKGQVDVLEVALESYAELLASVVHDSSIQGEWREACKKALATSPNEDLPGI